MKANVTNLVSKHAREIHYVMNDCDDLSQSQIEFISDNVKQILGYSPEEFTVTPWLLVFHHAHARRRKF